MDSETGEGRPKSPAATADLNRVALAALDLAASRLGDGVEVRRELGTPPTVAVDAPDAINAIVNLVLNAVESQDGSGFVALRTGECDDGGWIEVEDGGPGMSPELTRRSFEPYFTTKRDGTGLGLATVQRVVRRYNGELDLRTAPGQSTRVRLTFSRPPVTHRDRRAK